LNIFYISTDAIQAAQWMVDKHIVKMQLETAQILSTAHRMLDGTQYIDKTKTGRSVKRWKLTDSRESVVYSATHVNHPSTVWARQSIENYNWLVEHLFALGKEYTYRYGKIHKVFSTDLAFMLSTPPHNLRAHDMTKMPCAMADDYIISDDPVVNYRNYYRSGKTHLHSWKKRNPPDWI
jgi:hypothetical protein